MFKSRQQYLLKQLKSHIFDVFYRKQSRSIENEESDSKGNDSSDKTFKDKLFGMASLD